MRETEVKPNGWRAGGHGQQRNDGGGCASIRKIVKSGEHWYICN